MNFGPIHPPNRNYGASRFLFHHRMTFERAHTNITQTLTSLFEEMLIETEVSDGNRSNVDLSHFLSALREQSSKNSTHEPLDFGMLVKLVDGLRNKLNLSKPAEPSCTYCEGNFRDIILAYNSIHGYISLIVRKHFLR